MRPAALVNWSTAACLMVGALATAQAKESVDAAIKVECKGKSGSQVAIRWGHPTHDLNEYRPIFTVPCGTGPQSTPKFKVLDYDSEFEIQTEGGIETGYSVRASIYDDGMRESDFIELNHLGSPEVKVNDYRIGLSRSSGPNKYGEQNFRVRLPPGVTSAQVKIDAQVTGNQGDAQLALRWGHNDFHENEYFPIWTVKAGVKTQPKIFTLTAPNSEFEIQTEGGEGTGYTLLIWIDLGQGMGMMPSVGIAHKLSGTGYQSGTTLVKFGAGRGNAFGELNVTVTDPELPQGRDTRPSQSGFTGTVKVCAPGSFPGATLSLQAQRLDACGATDVCKFDRSMPISLEAQGLNVASGSFSTDNSYKPGRWQVTGAQVMNVTGRMNTGQQFNIPGNLVVDFTGGKCF